MINSIFNIKDNNDFEKIAIDVFQYQAKNNKVYNKYLENLKINIKEIQKIDDIIYLPILLFKTHAVKIKKDYEIIFESSGTTIDKKSQNYVHKLDIYEKSIIKNFEYFFGDITKYNIIGICPNYKNNKNSSLLYMINHLIKKSQNDISSFLESNKEDLKSLINKSSKTTILFGTSSFLMKLAESNKQNLENCVIIETGGNKGLSKDLTKKEMYDFLEKKLNPKYIYSEYGMAELISQAYALKQNKFKTPPWMKIKIRNINNPFQILKDNQTGGINIIDLTNYENCSFIQTDDIGRQNNNTFEILGRYENSMARGCSMLN
tara:strand:+ start:771 stop:1727 length:957 start_codon:yes stop_codon:yes gene_type:complete